MIKTSPVETVLSSELHSDLVEPLNLFHEALHEMVCFGTHVLEHELQSVEITDTQLTISLFYRRILELIDAIANLLKLGISDTSAILLRSLFETTLALEYLLKEDTDRRALCYQFCDFKRKHQFLVKHKPDHPEFKKYTEDYKKGMIFKSVPVYHDLLSRIQIAEDWMNRPEHAEIKAEYDRCKGKGNKKRSEIKWYSLFSVQEKEEDTLWTFQKLAAYLGKFDMYELFYKKWSDPIHGSNIGIGSVVTQPDDTLGIIELRNPIEAYEIAFMTARVGLLSMEAMRINKQKIDFPFYMRMGRWCRIYIEDYFTAINSYKSQFMNLSHFS